jgi:hypothetical protein
LVMAAFENGRSQRLHLPVLTDRFMENSFLRIRPLAILLRKRACDRRSIVLHSQP